MEVKMIASYCKFY